MKYDLVKKCEFLLYDAPELGKKPHKSTFPAINHLLAHSYALAVEPLLIFTYPERDAKIASLLYSKLVSHTAKHLIHKYKRYPGGYCQYKIWAIDDFNTETGKNFVYVEYPRMDDLVALKREVMNRTPIKVKNLELDKALDNLNTGAFNDFSNYTMLEFHKDFEMVHFFWEIMINYINVVRTKEQDTNKIEKGEEKNNTGHLK